MNQWKKVSDKEDRIVYRKGNDVITLANVKGFWTVYVGTEKNPLGKVVYRSKIKKLGALFMGRWIMQHNK